MFDLYYAITHQQELIHVTQLERIARHLRPLMPSLKDRMVLRLGDVLVVLGNRIRRASLLSEINSEPEDIFFPELLEECE